MKDDSGEKFVHLIEVDFFCCKTCQEMLSSAKDVSTPMEVKPLKHQIKTSNIRW